MQIKKTAVLGSGVMGSAIAAHMANAGIPVLLLDIVLPGEKNRNALTEKAVARLLETKPAAFTHPSKAKLITCGNLEDDLDKLNDIDWIVEAVKEDLAIKQGVYKKIDPKRKKGSVISSNTSTIPLHILLEGLSDTFRQDFMITHFFNPPRYMRLLEMVMGPNTRRDAFQAIENFADINLGKGVVECKDTPGFIANRIGVYWLMAGLIEGMRLGVTVEQADAVMGRPVGFPKTGVFGLFDLVGIDLMPLIAKEMLETLPKEDAFRTLYKEPELISKMIKDGYTGRKGKGGFYRLNKQGEKKIKEAIDLKTGDYRLQEKPTLASVEASKAGVLALLKHADIGGQYARAVLLKVLAYAASLVPQISDDVVSVDNAMKWGYNWKYGPFEIIDRIGVDALIELLKQENINVPPAIANAAGKTFYRTDNNQRQYLTLKGSYAPLPSKDGVWFLADKKLGAKPVKKNGSATLWDIGDGILCLEFTSKMNSFDPYILTLIEESIEIVKKDYKGLVIANDGDNFSVGANLGFILYAANMGAWPLISDVIKQGQRALMGLKYAPFPVVGALTGMALGGGCETILHCDAVASHVEAYSGLVEVGVGVIPGWGGCSEMLIRHAGGTEKGGHLKAGMQVVSKVFEQIGTAKVSTSAEEARDYKILNDKSRIVMNRARLLPDAKAMCLELAKNYSAPTPPTISLPGGAGRVALNMAVKGMKLAGKVTPHDEVVCKQLANVLTGGGADSSDQLTEQNILDLELAAFMELIQNKATLDRIEFMLENNKPLRN